MVVGAGPVGTGLAGKLLRSGVPVLGILGRDAEAAERAGGIAGVRAWAEKHPCDLRMAEVFVLAVPDRQLAGVAETLVASNKLGPHHMLLHTSGAYAATELFAAVRGQVRGVGTLHPLVSLADREHAIARLDRVAFAVEGDAAARALAARLVKLMGGRPLTPAANQMALYHAGAVFGSNMVVALAGVAARVLIAAGVAETDALPALVPLLRSAVANLGDLGLPAALTGPVARGDHETVVRHLAVLADTGVGDAYRLIGREVLRIAAEKNLDLGGDVRRRLASLLGGEAAT
jgi:predicted short-subunit dehydrogenase-like oxidoreductase (DUF2520 family)